MVNIKKFLMNRKYSGRMIFLTILTMISMVIIQDRYGLQETATEQILTPPQYEEYSRIMLFPILCLFLIPATFGMWYKERQMLKDYVKISDLQDTSRGGNYELSTEKKETETEFEYIIE